MERYFEDTADFYRGFEYQPVTYNSGTIRSMVKAVQDDPDFLQTLEIERRWEEVQSTQRRLEHLIKYADWLDLNKGGSIEH